MNSRATLRIRPPLDSTSSDSEIASYPPHVKIILCIFRIWVCVKVLACIRLLHLSLDSALSRLHCCKSFGTFWLAAPTCKQTQVWRAKQDALTICFGCFKQKTQKSIFSSESVKTKESNSCEKFEFATNAFYEIYSWQILKKLSIQSIFYFLSVCPSGALATIPTC